MYTYNTHFRHSVCEREREGVSEWVNEWVYVYGEEGAGRWCVCVCIRVCVCMHMHAYTHVCAARDRGGQTQGGKETDRQSERQREKHGVWGSHKTVSSASDLIAFHGVLQWVKGGVGQQLVVSEHQLSPHIHLNQVLVAEHWRQTRHLFSTPSQPWQLYQGNH